MTRIKFTKYGACTAFGEFGPGTIARMSPALAKHLVEDLRLAEYLQPVEAAPVVEPTPDPAPEPVPETVNRKGKRR